MCVLGSGRGRWGKGGGRVLTASSPEGSGETELKEEEGGHPWTHNRLVTEVSAIEFLLGIEGRVSPVEDKT